MVIEMHLNEGPYAADLSHYLRLLNYALVEPPRRGIEEDIIRAFLLRELRFIRELGYGSPADEDDGDGNFALVVCLGSEAILEHYRREKDVHAAARYAANCENWRQNDRSMSRRYKHVFERAREEMPIELWELNWICMDSFTTIMLPKMRSEGRLPERSPSATECGGANSALFVISNRSDWAYTLEPGGL